MKATLPSRRTVRALALAGLDVAIGFLLIILLVVAGALARLAVDDGLGDVREHPLSKRTAFQLNVSDSEDAGIAAALAQLRASAEQQTPSPAYELQVTDGKLWLVEVRHPDRRSDLGVADALADASLWTGLLTTDRQLFKLIERVLREPMFLIERLNVLGAWFLASTAIGLLLASFFLMRHREHVPIDATPLSPGQGWLRAGALGAIGTGAAWLLSQASTALGHPAQEQEWVIELARSGWGGFSLLFTVAVVLAPVAEEVFFRGHLLLSLAHSTPLWMASFVSALYFAVIHMNPPSFHIYLFFGLLFNWAYLRWGRLWITIVAHMIVNGVGIVMLRIGG